MVQDCCRNTNNTDTSENTDQSQAHVDNVSSSKNVLKTSKHVCMYVTVVDAFV